MKHLAIIFFFHAVFCIYSVRAQETSTKMYDSAHVYYKKKDFKKASQFFDIFYIEQKNTQSNYDTYFAAVASAHAGNMERAKYYLERSAAIGYDYSAYSYFADDPDNAPLRSLPTWKKFIGDFKFKADSAKLQMDKLIAQINDTTVRAQVAPLNGDDSWKNLSAKISATQLVERIKNSDVYLPTKKDNFWTVYHIKANDTLTIPFLVHIPKGYNASHRTPLYVYLHGAVANRTKFTKPEYIPNGSEGKLITNAVPQNAFIIYPLGKKDFGWLYQQQAFETVLKQITTVKTAYNIDDDRVYIGGHSNGGSGAFWFALNKPSVFASFFGMNYFPKAYFGNTPLRNLQNSQTFYGLSGDDDTTFPLHLVNGIYQTAIDQKLNWKNTVKRGSHGLPFEYPDSISFLFDSLAAKVRNPFPTQLRWQTDNVLNGRNAWLEITKLDTADTKANWHTTLNPTLDQNGKLGTVNFNNNKSGAIMASVKGNKIELQTSCVKQVTIYISPAMFDLDKKIQVIINNKKRIDFKLEMDKTTIVDEFLKTRDRSFIVSNKIVINIE